MELQWTRWARRLGLLTLLGTVTTGCVTTHLEFDRMTGTAFPAEQTHDGATVTLPSIYAKAGHLLVVKEDDASIPSLGSEALVGDDCITNAELDALESNYRSTQVDPASFECRWGWFNTTCTRYHLYGVVVNHYGTNSAGTSCSTGLLGRMWSTGQRQAFAMFYKNGTVSGDAKKYLRSVAHEIGHAYNLHHEDGDGSTTIMNQTGTVGNSYVYEFSTISQDHLKDHPASCKFPGTGSFYSVDPAHPLHSYVTADCTD